jgi:hypothetical protein
MILPNPELNQLQRANLHSRTATMSTLQKIMILPLNDFAKSEAPTFSRFSSVKTKKAPGVNRGLLFE